MRRGLIGGAVLAVLWFVCGWVPYFLSAAGGSLATLAQLIPSPMGRGVFGSPLLWAVIVQLLMATVLVTGFAVLSTRLSAGRASFAGGWLAAVLSAFAIGAALDLGSFFTWVGSFGIGGAVGTMGAASESTWWAVVVGWLPALVSMRRRPMPDTEPVPPRASRATGSLVVSLVAVLALILLPIAAEAGAAATQERLREEQATAQGRPIRAAQRPLTRPQRENRSRRRHPRKARPRRGRAPPRARRSSLPRPTARRAIGDSRCRS
nr:GAP family protein [Microbacterium sp. Se5.02b]